MSEEEKHTSQMLWQNSCFLYLSSGLWSKQHKHTPFGHQTFFANFFVLTLVPLFVVPFIASSWQLWTSYSEEWAKSIERMKMSLDESSLIPKAKANTKGSLCLSKESSTCRCRLRMLDYWMPFMAQWSRFNWSTTQLMLPSLGRFLPEELKFPSNCHWNRKEGRPSSKRIMVSSFPFNTQSSVRSRDRCWRRICSK